MRGRRYYYLMSPRKYGIQKTISTKHPKAELLIDDPLYSIYTPYAHMYVLDTETTYAYVKTLKKPLFSFVFR